MFFVGREYLIFIDSTTVVEASITHLHTRNRPCARVLRRHSGHAFPTILAASSIVVSIPSSHFIPQDRWVFFLSMNRQPRAL